MKDVVFKSFVYLLFLLTSGNAIAAPGGFSGPTWYDYRMAYEGSGTFIEPYEISRPEHLAQLSYEVNEQGKSHEGHFFVLTADINLDKNVDGERVQWIPIGYRPNANEYKNYHFQGALLGFDTKSMKDNGWNPELKHSISGMYIKSTGSDDVLYYGLFGSMKGLVLGVEQKGFSIDYGQFNGSGAIIGGLCGMTDGSDMYYSEFIGVPDFMRMSNGVDGCSVEGSISVEGNGGTICIGGVVGINTDYNGVGHTTSRVSISAENCSVIGGVVGTGYGTVVDCAADVNIVAKSISTDIGSVGGIVGYLDDKMTVRACSSMGTISMIQAQGISLGGIAGKMCYGTQIRGCSSTISFDVEKAGFVGGIAGYMRQGSGRSTLEAKIENCAYGGRINIGLSMNNVGGICGYSEWDNDLRIENCLFTGTINANENAAAIVGECKKSSENVGGCYYDKTMYDGPICGTETTHASVRGLTTDVMTLGDTRYMNMLPTDDSSESWFSFGKGYYPAVRCNSEWTEYYEFYKYNTSTYLEKEFSIQMFSYDNMYRDNTVYMTGSWLCSVPVNIPKGDTAYDLVTKVISPAKNGAWDEAERTITVNSKCSYDNVDCIRISNDTAYAMANGSFKETITIKADRPSEVWNRPLPLNGSKEIYFITNPDQVWDGTIGESYAAGSGIKEDPYIIKTGAQLACAVKNNKEGEYFQQLCDIILNNDLISDTGILNYDSSTNRWFDSNPAGPWGDNILWKGQYNGDGHFIKGAHIVRQGCGLFGDVAEYGVITNLGIVDSDSPRNAGLFAGKMNGTITNCIAQGSIGSQHPTDADFYMDYCGGFASLVGNTNASALIEDCISAAFSLYTFKDMTPFVSISDDNRGKVRNCLSVVPMLYSDENLDPAGITASGKSYIENSYWLKGYEEMNTGYTLDEICSALGNRKNWKVFKGYLPTLNIFANSDMAKLLMVPFRTDVECTYDAEYGSDNFLMGFGKQLLFEPGSITWTSTDENKSYLEADSDMGIIVPVSASFHPIDIIDNPTFKTYRMIYGLNFLNGRLGKYHHLIPVRTRRGSVNPGITFVDDNARDACLAAFDDNGDGHLSLEELKNVTTEETLTAFQTETARKIVRFPEFRFFKAVDELTTQLSGLCDLEEIGLPYALESIESTGGDNQSAFYGCTSLKTVTIPAKVKYIDGHPFYGSAVENIFVDPFNENFCSRGGILFDSNEGLVSYPNGRVGEETVIAGTISAIYPDAIYKIEGLERLYFETDDYETVPDLWPDGIVSAGDLIDVYVSDATYGSVLMQAYYDDFSWEEYVEAGKLHCYYPLYVGNAKAATLYIGFDTELPVALKPYIVTSTNEKENISYLRQMPQQVPNRSPIVIFADAEGLYRLVPYSESLEPWKMYENRLNGVGRDGMRVYQGDSDRGSILTLGRNSNGTLGFFYYLGERIQPYRAYLTHNEVDNPTAKFFISFIEDDPTDVQTIIRPQTGRDDWYTIDGRRLSGKPLQRGIYIHNGKKVAL